MEINITIGTGEGNLSSKERQELALKIQDAIAGVYSKIHENMQANEYTEKELEHLNHPFYKRVQKSKDAFGVGQILKGAKTYDEPFNPSSWTGRELYEHLMQELADAPVYAEGMMDHIERIEAQNEDLKSEILEQDAIINRFDERDKKNMKIIRENSREIRGKDAEIESLKEENKLLRREMRKIQENSFNLE